MFLSHVQGIFSPEHGGPTHSLTNYCLGQAKAGHRVSLWALEGFAHTSPAVRLPALVESRIFATEWPSVLGRSRAMRAALQTAPKPDVFHLHGAWLRAMHYGAECARQERIPYLLEVMGMYEPYSLQQKWPRKRFARWWYQDAILRHANCLHVNSPSEAEALRRLGFTAPIAVIPVGVVMPELNASLAEAPDLPELGARPFLLFLSRIHAKKGVDLLLRAWAEVNRQHPEVALVIAGTGEPDYVAECRKLAADLGIAESCLWPGRVTQEQKRWLLSHARVFVLPTFSENYGNVVAEALAHGTPVITTTGTPWLDLKSKGCGWVVEPDAAALQTALREALAHAPDELRAMGAAGRRWAAASFSLDHVLADMEQVYQWLLAAGPPPECVLLA